MVKKMLNCRFLFPTSKLLIHFQLFLIDFFNFIWKSFLQAGVCINESKQRSSMRLTPTKILFSFILTVLLLTTWILIRHSGSDQLIAQNCQNSEAFQVHTLLNHEKCIVLIHVFSVWDFRMLCTSLPRKRTICWQASVSPMLSVTGHCGVKFEYLAPYLGKMTLNSASSMTNWCKKMKRQFLALFGARICCFLMTQLMGCTPSLASQWIPTQIVIIWPSKF